MGWTGCVPVGEDNARFILLGIVLIIYMILGALIFQHLETDNELYQAEKFWTLYHQFQEYYLPAVINRNCSSYQGIDFRENETLIINAELEGLDKLHKLLYAYGNASAMGIIHKRRRWDFVGSFHFVGTIVSTIGYGNTTPQTSIGKLAVILYGFLGCSGGILFFNLFLERIITFLAFILRTIHLRRIKKRFENAPISMRRPSVRRVSKISRSSLPDVIDDEDCLENWKPSVYWVMLILTISSFVVATLAAIVYSNFENWTYFESVYFCFVSFATIGFGDFVATQEEDYTYPNVYFYRTGHFLFLVTGCCCIYSLFNVTSIVIKQGLNWVILKLQCKWKDDPMSATGRFWRRHSVMFQKGSMKNRRRRSSSAIPQRRIRRSGIITSFKRPSKEPNGRSKVKKEGEESDNTDSDQSRRNSGELISMKDFLKSNKVSLAVMQKELYETAQMQRGGNCIYSNSGGYWANRRPPAHSFTPGMVGPLAIVSEKLGDNSPQR